MAASADYSRRERRVEQLVDLALARRQWTRTRLAGFLECDPSTLCPKNGNLRFDHILRLAEALEWPVEAVVRELESTSPPRAEDAPDEESEDFETLNEQSLAAHTEGRWRDLVRIARRMFAIGAAGDQRGVACNRECGGWEGLGFYVRALEAIQRGLRESGLSDPVRLMLQSNLADTHYDLGHLTEAHSLAENLIQWYQARPPRTLRDRANEAFGHYVLGHTLRRLMGLSLQSDLRCAESAKNHLRVSFEAYSQLAGEFPERRDSFAGIANTCRGGLIEVDVELGLKQPEEALEELSKQLSFKDMGQYPVGDWLESYGWWCIFGGNIAIRYLVGGPLKSWMNLFIDLARDIAERLDNWALRQQVLFMQLTENEIYCRSAGVDINLTIDAEQLGLVGGVIGRFATFREIGWRILDTADRVIRKRKGDQDVRPI